MTPSEFLIAFHGFRALIGEDKPTPEQWARICELHTEAVGHEVKEKWAREEEMRRQADYFEQLKKQVYQPIPTYISPGVGGGCVGTTTGVDPTWNLPGGIIKF